MKRVMPGKALKLVAYRLKLLLVLAALMLLKHQAKRPNIIKTHLNLELPAEAPKSTRHLSEML
jgi:hypothetical protein